MYQRFSNCFASEEVRVASRGQEIVSVASQGDRFKCISCVPRWPLQVYQLRPKVTTSSVSVASQGDHFKCISCVPRWPLQVYQLRPAVKKELCQLRRGLSTPNMTSCFPRLVRNCVSCIERHGCTKCPAIGRFLQFHCTLLYTQLYAHIQNCWTISTTQLLYHVIV